MWKREIRYPLCLLNIASPSVQEGFLGCGRRAHLFPTDGLSLIQSAAHQKSKSPPKLRLSTSPLSHAGCASLSDYASPRARLFIVSLGDGRSKTRKARRRTQARAPIRRPAKRGVSDAAQNAGRNFAVGDALIMAALSSITASQTGNQVVVSMSSFLISAH